MKIFSKILIILLVILAVLFLGRNLIVKTAVEQGVGFVTGLKLSMQKLNIGVFNTSLHIRGLEILNPKGFEERVMLNMPEILVDYNLTDIIGGTIHLEEVIIDLQEFNVVKSSEGKLNLDSLKAVQKGKEAEKEKPVKEEKPPKEAAPLDLQIDRLNLRFGTLAFKDYEKRPEKPTEQSLKLNLDETYTDITNPQVLVAIIVQKALRNAAVNQITGFDLGGIEGAMTNTVGNVSEITSQALTSAKELTEGTLVTAGDVGKKSVEQVTRSAEELKKVGEDTSRKVTEAADKTKAMLEEQKDKIKDLGDKLKSPFGGN